MYATICVTYKLELGIDLQTFTWNTSKTKTSKGKTSKTVKEKYLLGQNVLSTSQA